MQMQKLSASIMVVALLVGVTGAVWAAGAPAGAGSSKADTFQQAWEQVKARLEVMRQNRESAKRLQGQAVQIAARIRAEIKRIGDAGLPLRDERVVRIRAKIERIKDRGRSLRETLGEIRQACIQAREARRKSEGGPVKSAYGRAEAVQEERLEHLGDLVNALEEVQAELESIP